MVAAGALALACYLALQLSPWPAALVIRWAFDWDARRVARAAAQHVPSGVAAQLELAYGAANLDMRLDAFLSGDPDCRRAASHARVGAPRRLDLRQQAQVGNYLRILAARGYTSVALDYSLTPAHTYPTPLRQANQALAFLVSPAIRPERSDFVRDPDFATAAVGPDLSERFPPSFIWVGDADPLSPQSYQLAAECCAAAVAVDALFFPAGTHPVPPHEYQSSLDSAAGQLALARSLAFLARR
jgi:acetyl esterase/lipase